MKKVKKKVGEKIENWTKAGWMYKEYRISFEILLENQQTKETLGIDFQEQEEKQDLCSFL